MNATNVLFAQTRAQLDRLGLPDRDTTPAEESARTFEDGCHFRIEVPTVNSAQAAETLLAESRRRGLTVNRVTETRGMYRHTAGEREFLGQFHSHSQR